MTYNYNIYSITYDILNHIIAGSLAEIAAWIHIPKNSAPFLWRLKSVLRENFPCSVCGWRKSVNVQHQQNDTGSWKNWNHPNLFSWRSPLLDHNVSFLRGFHAIGAPLVSLLIRGRGRLFSGALGRSVNLLTSIVVPGEFYEIFPRTTRPLTTEEVQRGGCAPIARDLHHRPQQNFFLGVTRFCGNSLGSAVGPLLLIWRAWKALGPAFKRTILYWLCLCCSECGIRIIIGSRSATFGWRDLESGNSRCEPAGLGVRARVVSLPLDTLCAVLACPVPVHWRRRVTTAPGAQATEFMW